MKKNLLLLLVSLLTLSVNALANDDHCLKALERRLSAEDRSILQDIWEPVAVMVPPYDARNSLCVTKDGQLRFYGKAGTEVYLASEDCGLSWKKHFSSAPMRACTWFPEFGVYVKAFARSDGPDSGTFVYISRNGPDDAHPMELKVSDHIYCDEFLPKQIAGTKRIYFTANRYDERGEQVPAFFWSDDLFRSCRIVELPLPPAFEPVPPHKGYRWCHACGTEPVACELGGGRMMIVLRNSTDDFYWSFSGDNGESWSDPVPSIFHGTLTTAFTLQMSDGRIINFWNNTRPLPELDHYSQREVEPYAAAGWGEDVFTNRDVCHAAVSSDHGRSWKGARELWLNEIRNNSDFRYIGGGADHDKSVHQFQALELPFGKVLVCFGQNPAARRGVIFDPRWLEETERVENFTEGLSKVSTHVYLKSFSGSTTNVFEGNGHCSWNRTHGAVPVPDPAWIDREVIQISRIDDPRLFSPVQGLVWNYPAATSGTLDIEFYLAEGKARISLADVWYNPCDEYVGKLAPVSFVIGPDKVQSGKWHTLHISFDGRGADLYCGGELLEHLDFSCPVSIGLSYLHLQCQSDIPCRGFYVKQLKFKKNDMETDFTKHKKNQWSPLRGRLQTQRGSAKKRG